MKPVFTVTKRLLASNRISFLITALVVLLATTSADSPIALSRGNYTWMLAVTSPFFFVFYDYTKLVHLGATKKDYYLGSLAGYGVLAFLMSAVNTLIRLVIDPLNREQTVVNLMDVCGWWQNGPILAAVQQFLFLLLVMVFLHVLLSVQPYWYGWFADALLAAVVCVFTPIVPLRGLLSKFFGAVMLNGNALSHLGICLVLTVVFALLGLEALKRRTI